MKPSRHIFTLALVVCVTAAYLWPDFFTAWGSFKLTGLIGPLLMLIMFGMGTTLSFRDFLGVAKTPLPVAVGVGLQFVFMPIIGFCLGRALSLEPEYAVGCVLVGSVAGGAASNVMAYLAKANVALSVSMTCMSTLLSPLLTPLLVKFYAGRTIEINALGMAVEIVKITILPTLTGLVVHKLLEPTFVRHRRLLDGILSFLSMAGICIILAVILGPAHNQVKACGPRLALAAVIHNVTGLVLGYGVMRLLRKLLPQRISEGDCRTVALEVGMQNSGMATQLAAKFISIPAALVPNIFGIWMDVSGSVLANWWGRHPPTTDEKRDEAHD